MPQQTLKVDPEIMESLKAKTPKHLTVTGVANMLLQQALDDIGPVITLGGHSPTLSKAVPAVNASSLEEANKETRAREAALRAEEIHAPAAPVRRPPSHNVVPALAAFEPQIRAYWAVKPKTKSAAAWNLLMRELKKILDQYGDQAITTQLELAEANRWQSITLANYEKFATNHRPGQTPSGERQFTEADYAALDSIRTPW